MPSAVPNVAFQPNLFQMVSFGKELRALTLNVKAGTGTKEALAHLMEGRSIPERKYCHETELRYNKCTYVHVTCM